MDLVKLTKENLNVEKIYQQVCSPEFGAVSLFVGTTRNNFDGKLVTKLEYEAYEGMATKSLENICQNIRKKFEVGNIAMYHRLGDVPSGEASVVIAISSKHRKPCLEAVPYAIDSIKAEVPIWKKEVYGDGQASEWKENSESQSFIPEANNDSVQLYEEIVEAKSENDVPLHLIQIHVNLQEVNRRINSFIVRKRQQIDASNIQDFFPNRCEDSEDSTCARVSAIVLRRKDSKSHLKVHKVKNAIGPQTHDLEIGPSEELPKKTLTCPPGAEERLKNAEKYLKINKTSKDVFCRLKAIEDKILYLESISPEYFDFDKEDKKRRNKYIYPAKRKYSLMELNEKMQLLEAKLQRKSVLDI